MCLRLAELELLRPSGIIAWLASPGRLTLGPAPQEGAAADAWALLGDMLREVFARHTGALEAQVCVGEARGGGAGGLAPRLGLGWQTPTSQNVIAYGCPPNVWAVSDIGQRLHDVWHGRTPARHPPMPSREPCCPHAQTLRSRLPGVGGHISADTDRARCRKTHCICVQARMLAAVSKAEKLLSLTSEEVAVAAAEEQAAAAAAAEDAADGDGGGGERQRIPTPGSRGPVSRLQMATMREEAASRKVAAAQQEVARQGELLQRLEAEQSACLLTVSGRGRRVAGPPCNSVRSAS